MFSKMQSLIVDQKELQFCSKLTTVSCKMFKKYGFWLTSPLHPIAILFLGGDTVFPLKDFDVQIFKLFTSLQKRLDEEGPDGKNRSFCYGLTTLQLEMICHIMMGESK